MRKSVMQFNHRFNYLALFILIQSPVRMSGARAKNYKPPGWAVGFYGMSLVGPRNRNVASRKLGRSSSCFMNLAPPIPQPPCGGIPYRKHSRYHCSPSWCNPFSRSCSHSFSYDSSRWAQVTISTPRYSKSADFTFSSRPSQNSSTVSAGIFATKKLCTSLYAPRETYPFTRSRIRLRQKSRTSCFCLKYSCRALTNLLLSGPRTQVRSCSQGTSKLNPGQ